MAIPLPLDTLELRSFVTLAQQLHFGRAADALAISQPALTKRLQKLEEKVGGLLLVRGRGSVRLTDPGRVLLDRARELLRQADLALEVSRQAVRGEAGLLRIGFGIASIAQLLPEVLLRFRRSLPRVHVEMRDMASAAQTLALLDEEIEVGFVRAPVRDAEIEALPILHERLVAAMGAAVPFRERRGLASLADQPFVVCARSVSTSYYDHVFAVCRRAGFTPRIVQEAAEVFTQLQLVRSGIGVALVPSAAASMRVPGVRFRELRMPAAAWDVALAWKRRSPASALVEAFVRVARQVYEERRKTGPRERRRTRPSRSR